MNLEVASGINKKYGIYTHNKEHALLFENDSAREAIQWAIDTTDSNTIYVKVPIEVGGTINGGKKRLELQR